MFILFSFSQFSLGSYFIFTVLRREQFMTAQIGDIYKYNEQEYSCVERTADIFILVITVYNHR